jgi:hypothetical protein
LARIHDDHGARKQRREDERNQTQRINGATSECIGRRALGRLDLDIPYGENGQELDEGVSRLVSVWPRFAEQCVTTSRYSGEQDGTPRNIVSAARRRRR